jgi:hypothetical protein
LSLRMTGLPVGTTAGATAAIWYTNRNKRFLPSIK